MQVPRVPVIDVIIYVILTIVFAASAVFLVAAETIDDDQVSSTAANRIADDDYDEIHENLSTLTTSTSIMPEFSSKKSKSSSKSLTKFTPRDDEKLLLDFYREMLHSECSTKWKMMDNMTSEQKLERGLNHLRSATYRPYVLTLIDEDIAKINKTCHSNHSETATADYVVKSEQHDIDIPKCTIFDLIVAPFDAALIVLILCTMFLLGCLVGRKCCQKEAQPNYNPIIRGSDASLP